MLQSNKNERIALMAIELSRSCDNSLLYLRFVNFRAHLVFYTRQHMAPAVRSYRACLHTFGGDTMLGHHLFISVSICYSIFGAYYF